MRLRGAKADLEKYSEETDGVIESTSKLQAKIKGLTGVDIMLSPDEFKSTYQIMSEVAEKWNSMSDINRANFLEVAAGKTRANQVASLLNNWSQAEKAYTDALNSAGTAAKENAIYLDSVQGRISQLESSFQKLSSDVIDSGLVKSFISLADILVQILDKTLTISSVFENFFPESWAKRMDEIKALPTILATISGIVSAQTKGQEVHGIGKKLPSVRAIERMHKPENCWKPLILVDQSAA